MLGLLFLHGSYIIFVAILCFLSNLIIISLLAIHICLILVQIIISRFLQHQTEAKMWEPACSHLLSQNKVGMQEGINIWFTGQYPNDGII